MVNNGPQEVVGVQHLRLQMRCVSEWLSAINEELEKKHGFSKVGVKIEESLVQWLEEGLRQSLAPLVTGVSVAVDQHRLFDQIVCALRDCDAFSARCLRLLGPATKAL